MIHELSVISAANNIHGSVVRVRMFLRAGPLTGSSRSHPSSVHSEARTLPQRGKEEDPPNEVHYRVCKMQHVQVRHLLVSREVNVDGSRREIGEKGNSPNPLRHVLLVCSDQQEAEDSLSKIKNNFHCAMQYIIVEVLTRLFAVS